MRFNAGEHFMIAPANHSGPQEKNFSSVKHTSLLPLANNLMQYSSVVKAQEVRSVLNKEQAWS